MTKDDLQSLATKFNNTINKIRDSGGFSESGEFLDNRNNFQYYPDGCCEEASEIFQRYLEEENLVSAGDVTKYRGENHSILDGGHYWLEVCGVTVDLTCSQFNDAKKIRCPLNCPYVDEHPLWHDENWTKEPQEESYGYYPKELYKRIRKELKVT